MNNRGEGSCIILYRCAWLLRYLFLVGYWFVSDLARINRLPTGYCAPLFVLGGRQRLKRKSDRRENGGRAKIFEKLLRFFSPFSFLLFVGEIIATRHFATAGSGRPISGDGSRSLETDMQIFMLPKSAAPGLLLSAIFQRSRVTFVPRERFANFSSR